MASPIGWSGHIRTSLSKNVPRRSWAGQRYFLELLARGENFPETLNALVRAMEEQSPGVLGMVRLLEQEGTVVRCGAAPSLPADFVRFIGTPTAGALPDSYDAAISERKPVVIEDIATDRALAGCARLLSRTISTPVGRNRSFPKGAALKAPSRCSRACRAPRQRPSCAASKPPRAW